MLSYLVTSPSRRRLIELLWLHEAAGSAAQLAKRARIGYASGYRELKRMQDFGLVTVEIRDDLEVYRAASDHQDAELLRRLAAAKPSSAPPADARSQRVRRRARALGAPLAVEPEPAAAHDLEQAIVDAVRLAHRDTTLARVLPVLLASQRDQLDRERLTLVAHRSRTKHALGFFLALTAELVQDPELLAWSAVFRDHRVRSLRPFFDVPVTAASRALMVRRTPGVAHAWGYLIDLDLADFASAFAKHTA